MCYEQTKSICAPSHIRHSCNELFYFTFDIFFQIILVGENKSDHFSISSFGQDILLCFSVIFPCLFQRFGKLLGMCKDPLKGTIWAYTSQSVFKYKVIREARWVKLKQCQNICLLVNKSQRLLERN